MSCHVRMVHCTAQPFPRCSSFQGQGNELMEQQGGSMKALTNAWAPGRFKLFSDCAQALTRFGQPGRTL